MTAAPYMRLYIADYLADTTHLDRGEHGAYLLLLMAMWRAGGKLPADDHKLSVITKCSPKEWAQIRSTMLALFRRRGGILTHKRVSLELEQFRAVLEGTKKAGKASAFRRARKNKHLASTNVGETLQRFSNESALASEESPEGKPSVDRARETAAPDGREANGFHLDGDAPPKRIRRKKPTRLPEDWAPDLDERAYAARAGLSDEEIDNAGREFQNYWCSLGGKQGLRSDWRRVWINRIDDLAERRARNGGRVAAGPAHAAGGHSRHVSFADLLMRDHGRG